MKRSFLVLCSFFIVLGMAHAQEGFTKITGTITDSSTGLPLPGANIVVKGTSFGAASNLAGDYLITKVPPGEYTILVRYIGYKEAEGSVFVSAGEPVEQNFQLNYESIEGEVVIVSAQAEGQLKAVNEQLNAKTIKSVVSADRIQELPDESAAAALSRLPGVSLQDGDKVVVRGIQAKMNVITINGVQLPSTDLNDRSTNLGFISSNMLDGIEVTKVLIPDMDANAIGGVVNLKLKEAPENFEFDILAQGAYNTQDRTKDNFKTWASVSNRFYDKKLGVFLQGNAERNDIGNDQTGATYNIDDDTVPYGEGVYNMAGFAFNDEVNVVTNYGGSLILDYQLPNGKIMLQNSIAFTENDNSRHRLELDFVNSGVIYALNRDKHNKKLMVNSLQSEHTFGDIKMDVGLSHSYSDKYTDIRYGDPGNAFGFQNADNPNPPFLDENGNPVTYSTMAQRHELTPEKVYAINVDPNDWDGAKIYGWSQLRYEEFNQHLYNSSLDFTIPLALSDNFSGRFKVGGKYTRSTRENDIEEDYHRTQDSDYYTDVANFFEGDVLSSNSNPLPYRYVRQSDYSRGKYYLESDYRFNNAIDVELFDDFMIQARDGWPKSRQTARSERNDFEGVEDFTAGYLMGDFNIGSRLSLIGGLRYESYNMDYDAKFVIVTHAVDGDAKVPDTLNTVDRNDTNWFPNAQLRYKFTDWADVRAAYSRSISRPDYLAILPNTYFDGGSGQAGNTELKPSISENFDFFLSFYENRIGLFTVGAFYKELSDVFFSTTVYYPFIDEYGITYPDTSTLSVLGVENLPGEGKTINSYVNNPHPAYLKGLEFDWQTNFWYLPKPLNSLVLNVNYTRVWSEMDYLQIATKDSSYRVGRFTYTDYSMEKSVRNARLLGQGDHLFNLAVGIDHNGFSGRVSFRLQDDVLSSVGIRPEDDQHTEPNYQWDISLKQKLPYDGWTLGFNGVNLLHHPIDIYREFRRSSTGPVIKNDVTRIYGPRTMYLYLRYEF